MHCLKTWNLSPAAFGLQAWSSGESRGLGCLGRGKLWVFSVAMKTSNCWCRLLSFWGVAAVWHFYELLCKETSNVEICRCTMAVCVKGNNVSGPWHSKVSPFVFVVFMKSCSLGPSQGMHHPLPYWWANLTWLNEGSTWEFHCLHCAFAARCSCLVPGNCSLW